MATATHSHIDSHGCLNIFRLIGKILQMPQVEVLYKLPLGVLAAEHVSNYAQQYQVCWMYSMHQKISTSTKVLINHNYTNYKLQYANLKNWFRLVCQQYCLYLVDLGT